MSFNQEEKQLEVSKCLISFIMELGKSGRATHDQINEIMTSTGYRIDVVNFSETNKEESITSIGNGDKIIRFNAILKD